MLVGLLNFGGCDGGEEVLDVDERAIDDRCFKTVTWVPASKPAKRCDCDPYNPCESTLLGEQCNALRPAGPPSLDLDIVPHICPDFSIGTRITIWRKQTFVQDCTIAYDCGNGPCGATGQKFLRRKKRVFEATICPTEIKIIEDKLTPSIGGGPTELAEMLNGLGDEFGAEEALAAMGIDASQVPDDGDEEAWEDEEVDGGEEEEPYSEEPVE
ncbi:MAG: hypothetical protein AAF721_28370 [Myxococcota bacterium]